MARPRNPQRWPDVPMQARTRRRIAIAVPLILTLAAAGYTARWMHTEGEATEPVEALRAFLEASHSGDVEAALAMTSDDPYGAEDLLVPEAMSADWEIQDLGLQSWSQFSERALVWATIQGPGDTDLTHQFDLERFDGEWKVTNPFATLTIGSLPVPYLEINELTLPMETSSPKTRDFALLPGVYQLFEHPPELFAYEAEPLLALGDRVVNADGAETPHLLETFEGFTIAEGTEAQLNERLTAYLDECLANPDGPATTGCPFALTDADIDDFAFTLGDDNRWEITEYPQAAAASVAGAVIYRPGDLGLLTRHEGHANVTAVDASTGEELALSCPVTTSGLYLVFDETGDYAIGPNQDPNAPNENIWADDGYDTPCEPA
jgi:hypothetical protein